MTLSRETDIISRRGALKLCAASALTILVPAGERRREHKHKERRMSSGSLGYGNVLLPALTANQVSSSSPIYNQDLKTPYQIPPLSSRPRFRAIEITRLYLPLSITANSSNSATPPTVAHLELALADGGKVLWTRVDNPALIPVFAGASVFAGVVVAEDFVNPIRVEDVDHPILMYTIGFDQAVTGGNLQLALQPTTPGNYENRPGGFYYTAEDSQ